MRTPINDGLLQSDLDCNGFDLLNFSGGASGGLPVGGTTGQSLTKNSDTNYDVEWTTVTGGEGGLSENTFNVQTSFGAAGDGRTVYDFVANGTSTLTSATAAFTSGDTGKTVAVEGVGAGGLPLVGTVTYVSATTITCSVAASSSASGKRGMIGTDDTTAFQDAIDAVDAADGGKIIIPDGQYLIAGAIRTTDPAIGAGYVHGQLVLPTRDFSNQAHLSIEFEGEHVPGGVLNYLSEAQPPTLNGAIICSFATGAAATDSIFTGGPPSGVVWPKACIVVGFKNLIFRTYSNPKLTPLNLGDIGGTEIENVLVDTGAIGTAVVQNTNLAYGIIMPGTNNYAPDRVRNTDIIGYGTAITLNEHCVIDDIRVFLCTTAFYIQATNHIINCGHILAHACTNNLVVDTSGPSRFIVNAFAIEHESFGDWRDTFWDISDPGNKGYGIINALVVLGGVGPSSGINVNGASNIRINNTYNDQNTVYANTAVYVGTDARLTPVSGGVKLEARNTGTGVWVEAARWTNP